MPVPQEFNHNNPKPRITTMTATTSAGTPPATPVKDDLPELVIPKGIKASEIGDKKKPLEPGAVEVPDERARVIVVGEDTTGWEGFSSVIITLACILLGFKFIGALTCSAFGLTEMSHWQWAVACAVTGIIAIYCHEYFWVYCSANESRNFVSPLRKNTIIVFMDSSLKPFWLVPYEHEPVTDFLTDREVLARKEGEPPLSLTSKDNKQMEINYSFMMRAVKAYIRNWLSFKPQTTEGWVRDIIDSALGEIATQNDYPVLKRDRGKVIEAAATLFGDDNQLSKFEQDHGVRITNPVLSKFDPPEESAKEVNDIEVRKSQYFDAYKKIIEGITNPTLQDRTLASRRAAQIVGIEIEDITIVEGVEGVKGLSLGGGGIALGVSDGKGRRKGGEK